MDVSHPVSEPLVQQTNFSVSARRLQMSSKDTFRRISAYFILQLAPVSFYELQKIPEYHRYRDGPDASGNGRKHLCFPGTCGVGIAGYFFLEFTCAAINQGHAVFNMFRFYKARITRAGNDDVGIFEGIDSAFFKRKHRHVRAKMP